MLGGRESSQGRVPRGGAPCEGLADSPSGAPRASAVGPVSSPQRTGGGRGQEGWGRGPAAGDIEKTFRDYGGKVAGP